MKDVMLKIKGIQAPVGGEEDRIELITEGKIFEKEDCKYLMYDESQLSGMEGCKTVLKIYDDSVEMEREGNAMSKLVFKMGERHVSKYTTPYGNFRMEILTKKLDVDMKDNEKGKISLEYLISLQGLSEGKNKLDIEIM